uniref:Uncharacterized protein n=1 Tax=Arion vulgaris TaxID=1028688 RepID=A0A0B6ZD05_9EUPU
MSRYRHFTVTSLRAQYIEDNSGQNVNEISKDITNIFTKYLAVTCSRVENKLR